MTAPLEMVSPGAAGPDRGDTQTLAGPEAAQAPAFVLLPEQDPGAAGVLETIRRHPSPEIYLKPVFLRTERGPAATDFTRMVDGAWLAASPDLPQALLERCHAIAAEVSGFARSPDGADHGLPLRLLRFMASRQHEFQPVPSARHRQGHVHPALETLSGEEPGAVLNALEVLEEQQVILGRLITTAHECTHCGCAFLNFTENCPQCGSVDLVQDDLVHHFRCGFTAELEAFRRGSELACPKCDRPLRHIGVDYDKPSSMFHCRSCAHDFQEPGVLSTCYDCGRGTAPENQPVRSIKAYTITALGQNAAALGLESLFMSIMERRLSLCPWESFQMFLKVETARIARYRRSRSSLLLLRLTDIEALYVQLGRRAHDVFHELAEAITQILRRSDLITARHDALFLALLTETSADQAHRAAERLAEGVGELLQNNIGTEVGLTVAVEELDGGVEAATLVERLLG